jgi:hypothetical protein
MNGQFILSDVASLAVINDLRHQFYDSTNLILRRLLASVRAKVQPSLERLPSSGLRVCLEVRLGVHRKQEV